MNNNKIFIIVGIITVVIIWFFTFRKQLVNYFHIKNIWEWKVENIQPFGYKTTEKIKYVAQATLPQFLEIREKNKKYTFLIKSRFSDWNKAFNWEEKTELMWVQITWIKDDVFSGTIDNEPYILNLKYGDKVNVKRNDILDWWIIDNKNMKYWFLQEQIEIWNIKLDDISDLEELEIINKQDTLKIKHIAQERFSTFLKMRHEQDPNAKQFFLVKSRFSDPTKNINGEDSELMRIIVTWIKDWKIDWILSNKPFYINMKEWQKVQIEIKDVLDWGIMIDEKTKYWFIKEQVDQWLISLDWME